MEKNRLIILAIVVLGIGASIGLSRCSENATKTPEEIAKEHGFKKRDVVYPREYKAQQRVKQRRKNQPLDTQRPKSSKASLDGLHRAMGGPDRASTVFLEVNAIRYSDLAEKILKCRGDEVGEEMERLKNELGIDPLEDIDRLAMQDDFVAATGFFRDLKLPPEAMETETAYGDGGKLYDVTSEDGQAAVAVLDNGLLLFGDDRSKLKSAIDRVEGREPSSAIIPRGLDNAEIYGRVDRAVIGKLLTGTSNPLADRFSELVKEGFIRINVDEEVSISLDLQADDPDAAEDLAKAVGGALAGLRKSAADDGEKELAWLLESAEVRPGSNGRFEIDVAVPGDFVLEMMGCDEDGNPTTTQKAGAGASEQAQPKEATKTAPSMHDDTATPPAHDDTGALGGDFDPTLKRPSAAPLPGARPAVRGFPTVIDDGT